jgi:hypothetical protein
MNVYYLIEITRSDIINDHYIKQKKVEKSSNRIESNK